MTSPYESAAREEKVLKLVELIDGSAQAFGVDPSGEHFPETLREMSAQWWRDLAAAAGVNEPSSTTIEHVAAVYAKRRMWARMHAQATAQQAPAASTVH